MQEKKKRRWLRILKLRKPKIPKINDDTLTSIVVYSLIFCVITTVAGFVFAWFGVDVSAIVSSTHNVFGIELGACLVIKLHDRHIEKEERKEQKKNEMVI